MAVLPHSSYAHERTTGGYFIASGPNDNSGSASKSALMTGDDFVSYTEYYIKNIRAAKKTELLLLHNHQSYLDIKVLYLAKKKE